MATNTAPAPAVATRRKFKRPPRGTATRHISVDIRTNVSLGGEPATVEQLRETLCALQHTPHDVLPSEMAVEGFVVLQWGISTASTTKGRRGRVGDDRNDKDAAAGGAVGGAEEIVAVMANVAAAAAAETEPTRPPRSPLLQYLFVMDFADVPSAAAFKHCIDSSRSRSSKSRGKEGKNIVQQPSDSPEEACEKRKTYMMAHYCMPTKTAPEMMDCDPQKHADIPGLVVLRDFIGTVEEERLLMQHIDRELQKHKQDDSSDSGEMESEVEHGEEGEETEEDQRHSRKLRSRTVVHYGYEFNYRTRKVDPNRPIRPLPFWCIEVRDRITIMLHSHQQQQQQQQSDEGSVVDPLVCDQLTINEYLPGHGILPHVDTHSPFEDYICSVSLAADTVMVFVNPDTGERKLQYVPARALMIMSGESRYLWRHGIYCRKVDKVDGVLVPRERRVSLTFRKVKQPQTDEYGRSEVPPCQCQWPKYCDSQNKSSLAVPPYPSAMKPGSLEEEHVHKFYDIVAEHWDSTRHSPWPTVTSFITEQPPGTLFADVGCGNGKYIHTIKEHGCHYVACDRSEKLVEICAQKYGFDTAVADATMLPYRSDTMDAVLCIAVMHHISSHARRVQLLRELLRIARPGGEVLVVAWALEQGEEERRRFDKQDVMVPWHYQKWRFGRDDGDDQQVEEIEDKDSRDEDNAGGQEEINKDEQESSKDREIVVLQRYCHVYKRGELEELLSHVDYAHQIVSVSLDRGNWTVRVKKRE